MTLAPWPAQQDSSRGQRTVAHAGSSRAVSAATLWGPAAYRIGGPAAGGERSRHELGGAGPRAAARAGARVRRGPRGNGAGGSVDPLRRAGAGGGARAFGAGEHLDSPRGVLCPVPAGAAE